MSIKDKNKGLYNVCFIATNVKWLASSKDLNIRLYTEDVKCSAYSKPLLGAVPTRSGGVVRIKRQQLEAGTQGQDANDWSQENRDTKSEMLGNSWKKYSRRYSRHTP